MTVQMFAAPRNESEAVQVALGDSAIARAQMALRAGIALALNPDDTRQVFYLAYALDRETLPRIAARLAADPVGRELIRTRAAIDTRHVDYARLRALPADTLGGAYARTLEAKNLDPDIFQRPPGMPEELAYVAQRVRQSHDLWHIVTGLDTDIPGEIALQAFTHAQLGQNFSKHIVLVGRAVFGLRYPRMWRMVREARRAGERANFMLAAHWEAWWADSLPSVRARLALPETGVLRGEWT